MAQFAVVNAAGVGAFAVLGALAADRRFDGARDWGFINWMTTLRQEVPHETFSRIAAYEALGSVRKMKREPDDDTAEPGGPPGPR